MPRPSKAVRRLKVNAALAYQRGDRDEAKKLYLKADSEQKALQAKKRNKNKKADESPE